MRNVIQQHRQIGGRGQRLEVGDQCVLRRQQIVGSDGQQSIGPRRGRLPAQLDAVFGIECADPGHHLRPVSDRLLDRTYQVRLLGIAGGGCLPGGAVHQNGIIALLVDQPGRQLLRTYQIDGPLGVEGSHHGGDQPAKNGFSHAYMLPMLPRIRRRGQACCEPTGLVVGPLRLPIPAADHRFIGGRGVRTHRFRAIRDCPLGWRGECEFPVGSAFRGLRRGLHPGAGSRPECT